MAEAPRFVWAAFNLPAYFASCMTERRLRSTLKVTIVLMIDHGILPARSRTAGDGCGFWIDEEVTTPGRYGVTAEPLNGEAIARGLIFIRASPCISAWDGSPGGCSRDRINAAENCLNILTKRASRGERVGPLIEAQTVCRLVTANDDDSWVMRQNRIITPCGKQKPEYRTRQRSVFTPVESKS